MKRPTLWKISVTTIPEAEEAVLESMNLLFGQPPSIYHDVETGQSMVSVYLEKAVAPKTARSGLQTGLQRIRECGLEVGPARVSIQRLKHNDWAEAWKRHFKPISLGSSLLIKPSWSKRAAVRGQAVVILDPGLSFGTGQHPTTRFCLEHLVAAQRKSTAASLLDIGTGSGILAIAAAKLGYEPIEAFDFDPEAIRIARSNARRNGVLSKIQFVRRDLTRMARSSSRKFDVVCANLTYDLLVSEHHRILNRLKPAGILVLAGILATQFQEVSEVYTRAGLILHAQRLVKEWQSALFVRR